VYLSELAHVVREEENDDDDDSDDVMILRPVAKPSLESCRGYWIETENEDGREGLIEGVDFVTKVMIVDFGSKDNPEEYEVDYDSPHIKCWFKMSSRREQNIIINAAIKLQLWAKRRLNQKSSHYTQTLSAMNSTRSVTFLSLAPSEQSLPPTEPNSSRYHEQHQSEKTEYEINIHTPSEKVLKNETTTALILRPIPRPSLEKCVGYWVALASSPDREALVREVDFQERLLRAEYDTEGDDSNVIIVSYDDTSLTWYRSSTQQDEMMAAIRIQTLVRGR
jgi:hypothetical protein